MKPIILHLAIAVALALQLFSQETTQVKVPTDASGFAFVLLENNKMPNKAELKAALNTVYGNGHAEKISKIEVDPKKQRITFVVDGRPCAASLLPTPVPKADIAYATYNSFYWPEAKTVTAKHTSHLAVFALGEFDKPWQRAMSISRVVATCLHAFDGANAVYWSNANILHEPDTFLQTLEKSGQTAGNLPISLWVGFLREYHKDKSVSLYTDGLNVLGAKEFEIVKSTRKMLDLYDLLFNTSQYVGFHGDAIADGDTIGSSDTERFPSKWAKSVIEREAEVIQIDF